MDKTLLLGSKEIEREVASEIARQALYHLSPKYVITDYSPGWAVTASLVASTMGIQLFGAMPYKKDLEGEGLDLYRKSRSSVVFKDFFEYINWLKGYANSVLLYDPQGLSSISQRVLIELSQHEIPVFKLSKGGI